jgi:tetratricopeptide (TPR) repeat protein
MTKRARRHFANAHERLPQSTEVALSLSRLHRAQGDLEAARRVVDESLKHQAGDPRLWRRRADLAFERNELDRARRAYRQTIATGDSSATAYRRIGLIDVQRQEYARALSPLQQSRNRDSTHTRTTLYLGIAFLKLDSLQRAATHFRRTVEREARGPITRALEQLGTAQSRRGAVTEAVEAYKTALRLQPARAPVLFHLATTYDEQYRDKRPAARYYRRFLEVEAGGLPQLRRYAERRLDALRPTLHMQEGDATSALP